MYRDADSFDPESPDSAPWPRRAPGRDDGPRTAPVQRTSGFSSGLPVLDTVDVLVAGGGPAGIGAALGAARTGAKTLVIENCSFFGGVGAWMMGMEINQMRPGGKPRSDVHELLIDKIAAYGDQALSIGDVNGHELWVNVEYLKVAILDAFDAVGAKYLVHVRAVDAVMDGNRITGVVVGTKRGLMVIKAKAVVDCTGDGDVAFFSGAETMTDPKSLMPMTLGLALANVDKSLKSADISAAHQGRPGQASPHSQGVARDPADRPQHELVHQPLRDGRLGPDGRDRSRRADQGRVPEPPPGPPDGPSSSRIGQSRGQPNRVGRRRPPGQRPGEPQGQGALCSDRRRHPDREVFRRRHRLAERADGSRQERSADRADA